MSHIFHNNKLFEIVYIFKKTISYLLVFRYVYLLCNLHLFILTHRIYFDNSLNTCAHFVFTNSIIHFPRSYMHVFYVGELETFYNMQLINTYSIVPFETCSNKCVKTSIFFLTKSTNKKHYIKEIFRRQGVGYSFDEAEHQLDYLAFQSFDFERT